MESQRMIALALRDTDLKVDYADSGIEAVKKLKENIYDLIILDMDLPDSDGITVLHTIEASWHPSIRMASEQIPFVIYSGLDDVRLFASQLKRFILVDHLRKPASLKQIRNGILSALKVVPVRN